VTFDLVLVGFGNVARRFIQLLHERRRVLARDYGFDARVVAILTRSHGAIFSSRGVDALRLADVAAEDGSISAGAGAPPTLRAILESGAAAARQRRLIVVETTTLDIERGEPATSHVRSALAAGAHVVTANKGPAAFAWDRLARQASKAGRRFLFEGAVMDGIPIFNLARETLPAATIAGFRGVLNTTTNFVLTAMEQGRPFDEALRAMQQAGIAEADPSLDVDGWDAAAKTSALANVLLGARITPKLVDREGIRGLTARHVAAARREGRRIKLVASAARSAGRISARVAPVELPGSDPLAQLEGHENAIVFETDVLGEFAIVQRGSGLTQTAYALLSDLVAIARDVNRGIPRARR
jgi:homoserine dehydrogenase